MEEVEIIVATSLIGRDLEGITCELTYRYYDSATGAQASR
jgi:hypothetical protein